MSALNYENEAGCKVEFFVWLVCFAFVWFGVLGFFVCVCLVWFFFSVWGRVVLVFSLTKILLNER